MMTLRNARIGLAAVLVTALVAGIAVVSQHFWNSGGKTVVVGYFDNSNGIFAGDEVRILGVPVGRIDKIEPEPTRAKITFWVDRRYKVPADADAVIMSPTLVTARAIQLTPAYTSGAVLLDGAVIPQNRTAVPVEWDDLREQLQKLSESLQPTEPGGVSPAGAFINTTADNLRGQGANIRDAIIKLSQAISTLGDHSGDIFSTVKHLSTLVSGLRGSSELMAELNRSLASVTAQLANDPDEIGRAVSDINTAAADVRSFISDHREVLGTTGDKLTSISKAVVDHLDDLEQTLHLGPTAFSNFVNVYEPAHGSFTATLAFNNFANPIQFLCSAIQAASRLGAEQSAKLCVQYLAPIFKNRQFNFPPIGLNLISDAQARPNEVTYSEDRLRPDYRPTPPPAADAPAPAADAQHAPPSPPQGSALPAEEPVVTNPSDGLPGMMVPPGGGS